MCVGVAQLSNGVEKENSRAYRYKIVNKIGKGYNLTADRKKETEYKTFILKIINT